MTQPIQRRTTIRRHTKRLSASARYRSGVLKHHLKTSLRARLRLWLGRKKEDDTVANLLRRGIWRLSRSYHPGGQKATNLPMAFDNLVARIILGEQVPAAEIVPYLSLEGKAQRAEVNAMLADAYFQGHSGDNLQQAKVFIQRAWLLSNFSPDLLPLYTGIFSALNDAAGIREATKRAGLKAAERGDTSEALQFFTESQYAYLSYNKLDKYEYDFDVLDCIDKLATPDRFHASGEHAAVVGGDKIRVAYLMKGILETNSILVKINHELAKYHDRSRFEVTLFVPESELMVTSEPAGREQLKMFADIGYSVVTAPDLDDRAEQLLGLARSIYESQPHLMVTSAALADADHYYITSLRPAPFVLGLIQGPTPQFAPPSLDWAIVWSKHALIDTPVNSSHIRLLLDWPAPGEKPSYSKKTLGLPEEAKVMLSGGRFPKFQSMEFWKAIAEVLAGYPEAFYLAVGPASDEVPFLDDLLSAEVKSRVLCLGWRKDFLEVLAAADVVIDTYPSGGGQVIVQAMSLGIPVVSHQNDYMKLYDQTDWSPVEDFLSDPELVIPRGDFHRFKEIVSKLLTDDTYRTEAGERCRAQHIKQADPQRAVRQCEETYKKLLESISSSPG